MAKYITNTYLLIIVVSGDDNSHTPAPQVADRGTTTRYSG